MTVRLALIGCGDHGVRGHLEAYRQLIASGEDARVAAVADRDATRAREAAAMVPGARWYDDPLALLNEERPDGVSIATPPRFHRELTLASFAAGAHVLCEKPLAMNLAEAQDMVAGAERHGHVLTMGLQQRYTPAARYLRELHARRDLGHVFHTRLWTGHVWRLPPSRHFLDASLAGGGVIAATLVHWLDVALWILGNPPITTVSATTYAKARHLTSPPPPFAGRPDGAAILAAADVEDFAYALIRFVDGSTLSLEASWLEHPTTRRVGIQFLADRGVSEYMPLAVRRDATGVVVDETPSDVPNGPVGHYFLEVARDFCRVARSGEPSVISGAEMLQVQSLVDAMYASARAHREIPI